MTETAALYLQLDGFKSDQILENRLFFLPKPDTKNENFLEALSAATPTPGGGSAAAHAGAMGAALVAMVARLTIGKKKYSAVENQMKEILSQADRLREELSAAVGEDSDAFEGVISAFKLPKDTPIQNKFRTEAIEAATLRASQVPLRVAQKSVSVMALAERVVALGNINAISDGASAAAMANAALTSAGYNVRINLAGLGDKNAGDSFLTRLHTLETKANNLQIKIQKSIQERGGFSLG
jgi:Methenyl tetrahydrofolate cyclohydrolase